MSLSSRSVEGSTLDEIRAFGRRVLTPFHESIGLPQYGEPVIWKLDVDPTMRGQGIGTNLINAAIRASAQGAMSVLVEHPSENVAAAHFYERLGFAISQIDEGDGPGATTVWRRKTL